MYHTSLRTTLVAVIAYLAFGNSSALAADNSPSPNGPTPAQLDNWHHWRGPLAEGVAPHANPPLEWGPDHNVRFRTPLPGAGSSSPIVWGNLVFLTAAIKTDRPGTNPNAPAVGQLTKRPEHYYQFVVLALDAHSGEVRWRQQVREEVPHEGHHKDHGYASASATTDGERLYVSFGSRGIYALDLQGNVLWERDLGDMRTRYGFGEGSSPVLHGDALIVNWDHEEESFLVSLDTKTGETRWRVHRDEVSTWATPRIVQHDGIDQIITPATNRIRAYDAATGDELWQCGGLTVNAIASPVVHDEVAISMTGRRGDAMIAVPLSARGDVTDTDAIAWTHDRGTSYVPSALLHNGLIYFLAGNTAILTCLDAASGEVVIDRTRLPDLKNVYASPVAAADRIYFTSREGTCLVTKAGAPLEVLATNELDEPIDASPALVDDRIYLRTAEHLYCFSEN